jgi:hypothetical protein
MVRDKESGYALLLVFLMAALLAITLYSEIPRVAFQSQRQKEQLLYTRGLQYIRGIQMYRAAFPGQPLQRIEDLETYQSRHFVRHKYIDPMTGKAEWRIIHMQNGVLIDSAVTKTTDTGQRTSQNYFIMPGTGVGGVDATAQAGPKPQDRRRASEGGAGGGLDSQLPPIPGPVSDGGTTTAGGSQTNPGETTQPGQDAAGLPGGTPQGQRSTAGQPSLAGLTGTPSSGPTPIPGQSPAANLIGQLLTQPRQNPVSAVGMAGANGIAGVASKAKQEGIMLYNDRSAYDEWEFVFDATRVQPVTGAGAGMGSGPMAPGSQQTGQTSIMQSRLGQTGGTGQTGGMQGLFGGMQSQGGQQGSNSGTPTGAQGMQNTGAGGAAAPPGYRPGRP